MPWKATPTENRRSSCCGGQGAIAVAISNATERGIVAPTTAAQHTARAICWSQRIFSRAIFVIVTTIPILTPFQNIAAHIIQIQFVGLFLFHGVGFIATVTIIPSHPVYCIATSEIVTLALLSASCSVFPLRFGGEAKTSGQAFGADSAFSFWIKACASSQLTISTGFCSPLKWLGLLSIIACHWAWVLVLAHIYPLSP